MKTSKLLTQKLLTPFVLLLLFAIALAFASTSTQPPIPPLSATPHNADTIFRLWTPYLDEVAVRVNDGKLIVMKKEQRLGTPEQREATGAAPSPPVSATNV